MLGFGAGLTGASVFNMIRVIAPNAVLATMFTSSVVAIFDRAYHLLVLPLERLLPPVRLVAVPMLARLQDDNASLVRAHSRLLRIALHATLPVSALCFCAADEIVAIMAGPQWMEAVPIFRALAPLAVTQVIASLCIWVLTATGKSRVLLTFSAVNAGLAVASVAIGATLGLLGVALAFSLVAVLVRTPILIAMTVRNTPLPLAAMLRSAGAPVAVACTLALGLYFARPLLVGRGWHDVAVFAVFAASIAAIWLATQGAAMLAEARWLLSNLRGRA